jgi:hypothetical protein
VPSAEGIVARWGAVTKTIIGVFIRLEEKERIAGMSVSTDDEDGNDIAFFDGVCDVIGLTPFENWQQDDRPISPTDSRYSEPNRHRVARQTRKGSRVDSTATSTLASRPPSVIATSSESCHSEEFSADRYSIGCAIPTLKTAAANLRKISFDPPIRCSMPSMSTRDVVGPLVACARQRDTTKQFRNLGWTNSKKGTPAVAKCQGHQQHQYLRSTRP